MDRVGYMHGSLCAFQCYLEACVIEMIQPVCWNVHACMCVEQKRARVFLGSWMESYEEKDSGMLRLSHTHIRKCKYHSKVCILGNKQLWVVMPLGGSCVEKRSMGWKRCQGRRGFGTSREHGKNPIDEVKLLSPWFGHSAVDFPSLSLVCSVYCRNSGVREVPVFL